MQARPFRASPPRRRRLLRGRLAALRCSLLPCRLAPLEESAAGDASGARALPPPQPRGRGEEPLGCRFASRARRGLQSFALPLRRRARAASGKGGEAPRRRAAPRGRLLAPSRSPPGARGRAGAAGRGGRRRPEAPRRRWRGAPLGTREPAGPAARGGASAALSCLGRARRGLGGGSRSRGAELSKSSSSKLGPGRRPRPPRQRPRPQACASGSAPKVGSASPDPRRLTELVSMQIKPAFWREQQQQRASKRGACFLELTQ